MRKISDDKEKIKRYLKERIKLDKKEGKERKREGVRGAEEVEEEEEEEGERACMQPLHLGVRKGERTNL